MIGKFTPSESNVAKRPRFSHGFNSIFNYWEIKPAQYDAKLGELALNGVRTVSAFVPWAHIETDLHHSLRKFLLAVWNAKLQASLFVMPASGVNYPHAGVPKDLLSSVSNLAVDRSGQVIHHRTAPGIFPLPSFSSPEVLKSFGNYLLKLSTVLAEVFKETGSQGFVEVVVTNAFFNYYRNPGMTDEEHGDYSAAHVIAFRDFLDREYRASAPEAAADAERFKMQYYENHNRHRFLTHVERLLRDKTEMVLTRKQSACVIRHVDLLNPEAAPASSNASLLTEALDFRPSVERFYREIVEASERGQTIHFSGSGVFRKFTDQEKSFLLTAAFIHSGEVSIGADELFSLPAGFHRKRRVFADLFEKMNYAREIRVTYVSASRFSAEKRVLKSFRKLSPGLISLVPSADNRRGFSERLVFADPRSVIRLVELVQLLSAAQAGKVVAIPAPMSTVSNYTADAAGHLAKFRLSRRPIRMSLGLQYEVFELGLGHVVFYDSSKLRIEKSDLADEALNAFLGALLGLAEAKLSCAALNPAVRVASFISEDDPGARLICLINPTSKAVDTAVTFSREMIVNAVRLGGGAREEEASMLVAASMEVSVPALGVLPVRLVEASVSDIAAAARAPLGGMGNGTEARLESP
ncbi:MAG: hypothetical protein HYW49_00630 [Deltaproteobacteria bacterium]|nr:hypothetical protein [Deltaproteobacteria bacterium]